MKLKKIISAFVASMMIMTPAFAEMNDESLYLDIILNYASNLYIDESVTSDDLFLDAVRDALKDNPDLMYSMIKSAFASLDEYSEFYTAEEYVLQYQRLNRVFYGMGVLIQRQGDNMCIIQVQDGGAKEAGILEGDIITAVDGTSVIGYTLDEVVDMVAGEEGTIVNVTVLRGEAELNFDVVRKQVNESTVDYGTYEGNIGYLAINSFSDITPSEVREALEYFDETGITKIILDMRGNPGGILESILEVAEEFVPEGAIMHTMYRDETRNITYNSENKEAKYKLVVLVNGGTASAAEALTGALQDSGVGYVMGEKTFGKGLIQEIFSLQSGDVFKITTGHYLTRDGHDIQGIGIIPDETVKNRTEPIDVSKYESFDNETKWKIGDTGKGVLAAKQRLNVLGYYQGTIDENFDYALEHAVNKFQADTELYPYGVLDFSTQAMLESVFSEVKVTYDTQFETALKYFAIHQ